MDDRTDEEIIHFVLQGHVQDFRYIIERHKIMAYRTAFSITRNHEDTEEVIQDAFLKAFNALGSFRGKSRFSTWFFRIVYYTGLNHIERSNPYKKHVFLDKVNESDNDIMETESWNKLVSNDRKKYISKALDQLMPEDRLVLTLFYLEEKAQKEIAALTGWNLAVTKVKIHRARFKIDQILEQLLKKEKDTLL